MCRRRKCPARRGVTLPELMIAISIMGLLAVTMATLSSTVEVASQQSRSVGLATQHARVTLERLERNLRAAYAVGDYPGFFVVPTTVGTHTFPDALVVWKPVGNPQNASGPPLMRELLVYAPHPDRPNELWELRDENDNRPAPAWTEFSSWRNEVAALFTRQGATRARLTDLLRTASPATGTTGGASGQRGAVRFEVVLRPSAAEWSEFRAGTRAWSDLSWTQGIYGQNAGLRQSWCQIELQIMPGRGAAAKDPTGQGAIPFFGSGALYYELTR